MNASHSKDEMKDRLIKVSICYFIAIITLLIINFSIDKKDKVAKENTPAAMAQAPAPTDTAVMAKEDTSASSNMPMNSVENKSEETLPALKPDEGSQEIKEVAAAATEEHFSDTPKEDARGQLAPVMNSEITPQSEAVTQENLSDKITDTTPQDIASEKPVEKIEEPSPVETSTDMTKKTAESMPSEENTSPPSKADQMAAAITDAENKMTDTKEALPGQESAMASDKATASLESNDVTKNKSENQQPSINTEAAPEKNAMAAGSTPQDSGSLADKGITQETNLKIHSEVDNLDHTVPLKGLVGSMGIKSAKKDGAQVCQMKEWGVQFVCNTKWQVLDKNKELYKIVLNKDPLVTVSLKRFSEPVHFLSQLNHPFMEKMDAYQDGFQMEKVQFAGYDAMLVKGYSKEQADTQLRDYFYIHDNKLFGIFFRLSPQERWEEGKLVIKEMKDNFSRIP